MCVCVCVVEYKRRLDLTEYREKHEFVFDEVCAVWLWVFGVCLVCVCVCVCVCVYVCVCVCGRVQMQT